MKAVSFPACSSCWEQARGTGLEFIWTYQRIQEKWTEILGAQRRVEGGRWRGTAGKEETREVVRIINHKALDERGGDHCAAGAELQAGPSLTLHL